VKHILNFCGFVKKKQKNRKFGESLSHQKDFFVVVKFRDELQERGEVKVLKEKKKIPCQKKTVRSYIHRSITKVKLFENKFHFSLPFMVKRDMNVDHVGSCTHFS
jgi:hypothetical protein